ncbi:MAG: hypothetical protein KAU62_01470 [Candidatus Heimdallarchaeota archaeon]|nr:hypothetical protein [Candidatus Heimdallarchaeota archaeon]MCK4609804.1 hypothetical protein [Candidatus Heimdallarchaeota archaeon]
MLKIKTLKGRKWFLAYSSLITITFLLLLLFGSIYSTISAEKQKILYLETTDIGSKGTYNSNTPDFSYISSFNNFSSSDIVRYNNFLSELTNFSNENHFTPYVLFEISSSSGPMQFNYSKINTTFTVPILVASPSILEWMFPGEGSQHQFIHFSGNVSQNEGLEYDEEIKMFKDEDEITFLIGSSYYNPYYIFLTKIANRAIISSEHITNLSVFFQEQDLVVSLYLDIDSSYLLNTEVNEINDWLEEITNYIDYIAEKNNLLFDYYISWAKNQFGSFMEDLIANYGLVELTLLPSYLILVLILWVVLKEGLVDLRKELYLYLTRGAQKAQFVKHYAIIFIISDLIMLIFLSGMGELITQLSYQISSILTSILGGMLTLLPLEAVKIYSLHNFVSKHVAAFTQESKKQKIKLNQKDLSLKQLLLLMIIGTVFLIYSFLLPFIIPIGFISTIILISRVVAGVLVFIAITLFSTRISFNTSLRILNKISSKYYAITKFIEKFLMSKRRNFKMFTLISFWLIFLSSFTINTLELDHQSQELHDQSQVLDIELYVREYSFMKLTSIESILSDEDIENYIPLTTMFTTGNHFNKITFLPILNVTQVCPSFFNLENAKGENINFQSMNQVENSLLVSHNVIERKYHEIGDNISLSINPSGQGVNFTISETPLETNFTIFDEFNYFPFIPYFVWYDEIDPTYHYITDISLLEELFGELFFDRILIKLRKNVDPQEWYNKTRSELGGYSQFLSAYIPEVRRAEREETSLDDILVIEVFILSMVVVIFTLFYFQSITKDNKNQILIALSRGIDSKKLKRGLILSSFLLLMINIVLGFLVGVSLSAIFHFGVRSLEIRMFKLSLISLNSFFFLLTILGGSFLALLVTYKLTSKRIDTSILTQMGETVLGE